MENIRQNSKLNLIEEFENVIDSFLVMNKITDKKMNFEIEKSAYNKLHKDFYFKKGISRVVSIKINVIKDVCCVLLDENALCINASRKENLKNGKEKLS